MFATDMRANTNQLNYSCAIYSNKIGISSTQMYYTGDALTRVTSTPIQVHFGLESITIGIIYEWSCVAVCVRVMLGARNALPCYASVHARNKFMVHYPNQCYMDDTRLERQYNIMLLTNILVWNTVWRHWQSIGIPSIHMHRIEWKVFEMENIACN